ncbi:MAG: serine hydrolase domain-containing protein [Bergeyella zoohelcum]|nr:serine hydrolase domain-containing protein [Bergeyella zoohelcum]
MKHLVLSLFIILFACSDKKETKPSTTHLPNFGNVDLSKVFTQKDSQLPHRDSVRNILNQYYQKIWQEGNLWGGILVAKGDDILLEQYRGFARDNQVEPIGQNTPLHIASVSKTIMAMAVLKLVEAKKIGLEDPVKKFLPKFPYPEVSIKTLLNHRSGLPKYEHFITEMKLKPKNVFFTNQEVLDLLIQHQPPLAKPTDTGFMYNNLNYALLALVVERVTKMPFPKAMKTMVFEPLQMKNTFVFQEKDLKNTSFSFYQKDNKVYPYDEYDLIYGDKNIYTTPRDLFRFSKAMFSSQFLDKNLMDKAFTPYSNEKKGVNNYGLGFRIKVYDDGKKLTYHNGWWHGSNSVFVHLPESKITIIALGNKYSNKVYSAMTLVSLFDNFPYEISGSINHHLKNLLQK